MNTKRKTSLLLASLLFLAPCNQSIHAADNGIPWIQILHWLGPIAIDFGGRIIITKCLEKKPPEKTVEEKLIEKKENLLETYDEYQDLWAYNKCGEKTFSEKPKCKKYTKILHNIQSQREAINHELYLIQTDEDYLEI